MIHQFLSLTNLLSCCLEYHAAQQHGEIFPALKSIGGGGEVYPFINYLFLALLLFILLLVVFLSRSVSYNSLNIICTFKKKKKRERRAAAIAINGVT
jgi:hypothetical protein